MNEAWTWRPLRELTIRGATWNPRADPRPSIRYIDVSAVSRDELRIVSEATYSAGNAPSRARKIVESGDTIFATVRPTLRRIAQIPESLDGEIVSTAFCVLRPDRHAIDADFLYFATQLESVMEGIAAMESGASYPAVRDVDVLDQVVPLPPLPEQREIAAALNTIRTASLHQAQCEANATALKRAAMRELFTHGLRGEAQKETEIGPVPASWELSTLGTLCESTDSVNLRSEADRVIKYVDVSSISRDYLCIETTPRFILKEAPGRARKRILTEDVIFATVRPTLLRVAVVPDELDNQICSTAFCVLRRDSKISVHNFIYYVVQRDQFVQQLAEIETGASYPAVTDRMVKEQVVPVPSLEEQREIIAILDAIDRKIDLHRRKRAVLDDLFKVLLHRLMTGEMRVDELDLSIHFASPVSITNKDTASITRSSGTTAFQKEDKIQ